MPKQKQKQQTHVPVLLSEVLEVLTPQTGDTYLDLTAGYGGHASEIRNLSHGHLTLVDRDQNAVTQLKSSFTDDIDIVHADFLTASESLLSEGKRFDMLLADLGVSSPHLDIASRGFSIQSDGPLDMRMDQSQALSASEIVNSYSVSELTRILKQYGEEPKAKRIATLIEKHRPVESTHDLAQIVSLAWPGYSKTHPATRTFQALRIAVNDELGLLERSLPIWLELLAPGGRLAVISFHSLEDRIVKQFFNDHGGDRFDAEVEILTKRPITASTHEIAFNPRARSARLRACKRK